MWWVPLTIYSVGRCISALILWWGSRFQGATGQQNLNNPFDYFVYHPRPSDPGYLALTTNWDGQWYEYIATEGYQAYAIDPSNIANYAWNFPPLFPYSVRTLMRLTDWSFAATSAVFSTLVGAIASLLIFHLIRHRGGTYVATAITILNSLYITSPLFQVAYSESLGLLLVAASLILIERSKYGWAMAPVLLLCFTRLISPPLAFVVLAHTYYRHRNGSVPLKRAEWIKSATLTGLAIGGVGIWPMISQHLRGGHQMDRATGMLNTYQGGWFGELWKVSPALAILPLALVLLILLGALRSGRQCGLVVGAWAFSYPFFLLASTPPLTGILRYFMFAFPLAILLVPDQSNSPRVRRLTLVSAAALMLVLQVLWVRYSFVVDLDASPHIMP